MAKQPSASVLVERSFDEAATLMWAHYKAHKDVLQADIRDSRAFILQSLMSGKDPEPVFASFVLPPEVLAARKLAAAKKAPPK